MVSKMRENYFKGIYRCLYFKTRELLESNLPVVVSYLIFLLLLWSCSGLHFDSVDEISKLLFAVSTTRWINPSDCVDMDCDARRQLLVRDLDGSLTGAVGSSVISMAEYQWNGEPAFGLGMICTSIDL